MAQKKKGLGRGLDDIFLDNHTPETADDGITMVRIGDVEPNAEQPRKNFDATELEALAESIGMYGMIQPITVRAVESGMYQIVTGERRWRAARMAGLSEVPVIIIVADDKKAAEMALVENIQRSDLNPIEEALGYAALIEEYGLTQEETAKRIGKSRSAITNALRLLNLPEAVRKMVEEDELSTGHAKVLLGLNNQDRMEELANQIIIRDLSVRDTEKLVKMMNEPPKAEPEVIRDVDHTRALEVLVQKTLGRTVKISEKGKNHSITIGYSDNEDLETLLKLLCGDSILEQL
ncbi:MAG: ParB/RepB/Spo0J family partition protein [Clostridia bacterium]|nr:ParB/RepB/Spo0J family partition protein [Clostridia bacterium]MBP3555051.1 ParB/RepB/Spo0J family partition protein [Clostridia bacterium]MBQ8419519.1 ParB/RepB/Spo0J family partition protein [Clostridia bacterium]